jgi:hypothetical protein
MRPPVLALLLAAIGCTAPNYGNGHLQCAPGDVCPSGFYCAADEHCWRFGSGPSGGVVDLATNGSGDDLGSTLLDLAAADFAIGPSKCGPAAGVILCENFENALLPGEWTIGTKNGTATRDSTHVFRGSYALHAHLDASNTATSPHAYASEQATFPIGPTIYSRVWAYFPSPLPASFNQFLNFTDNGSTGFSTATDNGNVALDDYAGPIYQRSTTKMPLDRWVCIQFEIAQGSAMGAMRIRVDGQLLSDLPQSGYTTTAINLSLGLDFYGNSVTIPAYDAWFDELILDNKATTCDQ